MKRSVLLDILRAFSVIAVVLGHVLQEFDHPWGNKFGIPNFYYVSMGGVAVTVLIIISGIVLGLRYTSDNIRYWDFIKKRILRIYPVYYLILAGAILAYVYRDHLGLGPGGDLSFWDIPLALTGTYAIFGRWGGPFVGTSWFLCIIMSLYLAYPFLVRGFEKKPRQTLAILFAVSVGSRFLLGQVPLLPLRPHDWFLLCRIFEFGLGIYLARTLPEKTWYVLNRNDNLDRFFNYLGELSFPLFLAHWPIFHTVKHMRSFGYSDEVWVSTFIVVSLVASMILLVIDKRLISPYLKRAAIDI